MKFFSQPCVAPSESARLGAKQGHATSAKRNHFSAFFFLKFRIPRVSASRNRGAHFAFPNQITPLRPLRAKARPGNAGREQSVPQSPITNLQSPISNPQSPITNLQSPITNLPFRPASAPRTCPDPVGALVGAWRPWREQSAFSLTEVVIAMGVAAVAFTSIIALFPLGLNMSKESYEATQAALIAQTIYADAKDQQTGSGNERSPKAPWNTRLIQIANNSDPINVLTNYATVQIDQLTPQIVYIAYKPFVGTGNDTDTNNPAMLRPSTGLYTNSAPIWYSTGSNGATMLVKVTFSPTIRLTDAKSTSTPRRVDISVETPGSANISNRTCYLFTGAVRQ